MMHCHIDIHHGEGMAMIIQEGESDEIANMVKFDEINLCENNLERLTVSERPQPALLSREKLGSIFQMIVHPISKAFSRLFS